MKARSLLTKSGLAFALLHLALGASSAAGQSVVTGAAMEISEPAAVRVVRDAPMVILISSGVMTQFGATFALATASGGISTPGFVSASSGPGNVLSIAGAGAITGTTIYGEALSISVGGENADSTAVYEGAPGTTVRLVIAQYN